MRCGRRRCLRPHPLLRGLSSGVLLREAALFRRGGGGVRGDRCGGRRPRRTGSMPRAAVAVVGRAGRASRLSPAVRQRRLLLPSNRCPLCAFRWGRFCGWPVKPCFGRAFRIHFCYRETYVCFPIALSRLSFAFESGKWRRPKSFAWRDALA